MTSQHDSELKNLFQGFGPVRCPDSLWERILPEVRREAARRARPWWTRPALSAAAALLFCAVGFLLNSERPAAVDLRSASARQALAEHYRARVVVLEVAPSELSASARALATLAGAPIQEEWE